MRRLPPGRARGRIALLTVLAIASMALASACSGKVIQAGGLYVVISTNLTQGKDFDFYTVLVEQETPSGPWHKQFGNTYPVTAQPLPTSLTIAAGTSSDQNARITVTATLGGSPVLTSEAQVQVPTDRVLELDIFLAQSCVGKTCMTDETCKDKVGCTGIKVDPTMLSQYQPGGQDMGSSGGGGSPDATTTGMPDATVFADGGGGSSGGTGNCACPASECAVTPSGGGGCMCQPAGFACPAGATCTGSCSGGTTCGSSCPGCCDPKGGCVNPGAACPSGGTCSGGAGAPCTASSGTCGPACGGCCDSSGACVAPGMPCAGGLVCNGGGGVACGGSTGCTASNQAQCTQHGGCWNPAGCICMGPCPAGSTCTATGCSGTAVDSGTPCGSLNQVCCPGAVCNSGYGCDATNICTTATACGQIGESCCSGAVCNNSQAVCGAANTCIACGQPGQPCCKNGAPGPGGCMPSGTNQVFCAANNTCVACGALNQPCCGITDAGGGYCSPGSGSQILVCASGTCQIQCGTSVGAPCCGSTCTGSNLMCSGGTCASCGGPGQTCCPYNNCFNQSNGTYGCCIHNVCVGSGQSCPASVGGGICGGNPPQNGCVQPDGGTCGMGNCCTGSVCTFQNMVCNTTSQTCTGCGYAGSTACPDGTCTGGSINQGGNCVSCGGLYQACCNSGSGNPCNSSYYCDGGVCL